MMKMFSCKIKNRRNHRFYNFNNVLPFRHSKEENHISHDLPLNMIISNVVKRPSIDEDSNLEDRHNATIIQRNRNKPKLSQQELFELRFGKFQNRKSTISSRKNESQNKENNYSHTGCDSDDNLNISSTTESNDNSKSQFCLWNLHSPTDDSQNNITFPDINDKFRQSHNGKFSAFEKLDISSEWKRTKQDIANDTIKYKSNFVNTFNKENVCINERARKKNCIRRIQPFLQTCAPNKPQTAYSRLADTLNSAEKNRFPYYFNNEKITHETCNKSTYHIEKYETKKIQYFNQTSFITFREVPSKYYQNEQREYNTDNEDMYSPLSFSSQSFKNSSSNSNCTETQENGAEISPPKFMFNFHENSQKPVSKFIFN